MDYEGVEGDEFRSSAVPNTRRRIATTTSLEENKSDEGTVAVTIQESLDGIREKVMRIASLDELEESSGGGPRNKKVNEIVRTILGLVMKEGDTVVAPTASQSYGKT